MSVYDYEKVALNIQITKSRKNRLEAYCRVKGLTKTMLVSLFIDELRVTQIDEPVRRNIEESVFKMAGLLGFDPEERPIQESINNENGWVKHKILGKTFFTKR